MGLGFLLVTIDQPDSVLVVFHSTVKLTGVYAKLCF
jgi:hypothetical protein